ncbi:MAG: response regulator [Candidatus Omnitrophica bacterium]|nr:response regulator [Candidatus Omnitrophota bacterium]
MKTEKKILIVDDESDVLESLSSVLGSKGYHVLTAGDGEAALELVRSNDPDLIILDIMMPKINGIDVLHQIRHEARYGRWRPVIIFTGRGDFDDVSKGYKEEADYYIVKPAPLKKVVEGVEIMLSLAPLRKK